MNKTFCACFSLSLFAITSSSMASYRSEHADLQTDLAHAFSSYVIGLQINPTWTTMGNNQVFYLQPDIEKAYIPHRNSQYFTAAELFLGTHREVSETLIGQFGLALAATSQMHPSGDIWEDASPLLDNYNYAYNIQHGAISIKGKLLANYRGTWFPYVSGSVGAGFNRASNFAITPKIFQEVPAPAFNDRTQTDVTYTVGIGVQKAFQKHWQLGIGYEFSNLGGVTLARAPEQTLNMGVRVSNIYTNAIAVALQYIA